MDHLFSSKYQIKQSNWFNRCRPFGPSNDMYVVPHNTSNASKGLNAIIKELLRMIHLTDISPGRKLVYSFYSGVSDLNFFTFVIECEVLRARLACHLTHAASTLQGHQRVQN